MKQYTECLWHILDNGVQKPNRTGIDTLSTFGYQMRFDLQSGFPAITTKKLLFKHVVSELLWFLEGSTDERRLAEIHYNKDRSELVGKQTIWTANADNQGKLLGYTNNDIKKELGPIYSHQWKNYNGELNQNNGFDQLSWVINEIKHNPSSRRLIVNAWNPIQVNEMALPPCHTLFQFDITNNKLSCQLYQRSVDAPLGLPFNIASYSLLTHMIARECNLDVGEFIHTSGDLHIYVNQKEAILEQLSREPLPLPTLWLNPDISNIFEYGMNDIKLLNYVHHPEIKIPFAV